MIEYAFPVNSDFSEYGLTKREYAAIHIAAALVGRRFSFDDTAFQAVRLADAVLREAGE